MTKIQTKPVQSSDQRFPITHRQELIGGFNQSKLSSSSGIIIGAGGLGGEVGEGLCRKGIGCLRIFDHDVVDATNLNRQNFFPDDIGRNKAECLVTNLAPHCHAGTKLEGFPLSFQDAIATQTDLLGAFVVCAVDNGSTRVSVSEHYRHNRTPVIFLAVDLHAEAGHVFVQESAPNLACLGCAFPRTLNGSPAPCFVPSVKDILKVTAGFVLYAIDSLLMQRQRNWNYRRVHLAGFAPDVIDTIPWNPDCPLCRPA